METKSAIITTLSEVKFPNDIYIINGFYDYRIKSFRMFTFGDGNFSKYMCYLEYKDKRKICKYRYKPYRTFNFPYGHLIISIEHNSLPENIILNGKRIKVNIPQERENQYNLTVCISKMIEYTPVNRFIQTIESYRRFGSDHFTIYLTSASERVMKVIKYYESLNLIELIRGNATIENESYLKRLQYGELGKGDDCIYRNLKQSKRVAVVDLDEIIWPLKSNTLIEMTNAYNEYNGFSFRSFLFYTDTVKENDNHDYNIVDLNIFKYRKYCRYKEGYVIKNIYTKMDAINSIFVHWAIDYSNEYKEIDVPYDVAYIRHTRRFLQKNGDYCETGWMTMTKDKREDEINNRTKRIRKIVNL